MEVFYDMHIHSCLSPCSDDDMTPHNICQMAKLKGLDVIAIADHNCAQNCQSFINVGRQYDLLVVPAMELQTREDVHLLCFFPSCQDAQAFERFVAEKSVKLPNHPKKFGHQTLVDEEDEAVGEVLHALILSTGIGVEEAVEKVKDLGGVVVPAHIDKKVNSIIANLGFIPAELGIKTIELSGNAEPQWTVDYHRYRIMRNSDAHQLWQISEPENHFDIPEITLEAVLKWLGRVNKV